MKNVKKLLAALLAAAMALTLLVGTAGAANFSSEDWLTKNIAIFKIGDNYYQIRLNGSTDAQKLAAASQIAYASTQSVLVNGKSVTFEAYALKDENGYDTNYIKLRDVAYVLDGTTAQFQVGWDGAVNILPGKAYTPTGLEMSTPYSGNRTYTVATSATKVNGQAVSMEAILLQDDAGGGYTYYKLRDLGAALNFTVSWTAQTGITIDTPAAAATPTLANGKAITDDNIREIIYGLKVQYPEGMHWTNDNSYYSSAMHITGYGCAGFALICSDAVFGTLPITSTHSNFDAIKVGDMLRVNNDTHSVVVLEKRASSVIVTEGNYNSSIHWGREISRQSLEKGNFVATSRYPK